MEDFERELKEDFLEESLQLLEDTEQSFLALENDKESSELLDQIFRLAHNLKGTSRAVGFGEVAEFTHEMENLILKLKTGEISVTDSIVTILLECNDHITHMINSLRDNLDATFDSEEIISKVVAAINGEIDDADVHTAEESAEPQSFNTSDDPIIEEPLQSIPSADAFDDFQKEQELQGEEESFDVFSSSEMDEMDAIDESNNITPGASPEPVTANEEISAAALESLRELGLADDGQLKELELKVAPKVEEAQGLTFKKGEEVVAKEVVSAPVTPIRKEAPVQKSQNAPKKRSEDESIRVALSRVEKLNNVVGELVILQTVLDQRRFVNIQDDLSNKSIGHLGKLSKEIQEISMSLRMVPLKATLQKMNRIVRDTSKTLNKQVKLHLVGEDTEIDKTVLEHLADPLVHIVRNAVDHGLESTQSRIQAGKDEVGNVEIAAFHEGNNLVIEISDDGGGIPAEVIRNKAIEKNLISAQAKISDDDIIQYIFHPGFSTKEQVTEVSGRGVGMDVVKTNIEGMSGSIKVTTEMGKGSVFKISLPLTMAIIDGMIVRLGGEKYIIPLSQVHESLKPTADMVNTITGFGECLNLRGDVLPLFNVGSTLGRKTDEGNSTDKIAIIIHSTDFNFAVLVDDILHQQQVVIKTLGEEIRNSRGFMGSSILGDGRPAFILDLNELYKNNLKKNKNSFSNSIARAA